jgi:hypothetical protein
MAVKLDLRKFYKTLGLEALDEQVGYFLARKSPKGRAWAPLDKDTERQKSKHTKTKTGKDKSFRGSVAGVVIKFASKGAPGRSTGKMQRAVVKKGRVKAGRQGYRVRAPKGVPYVWAFQVGRGSKQPRRPFGGLSDDAINDQIARVGEEVRRQIVEQIGAGATESDISGALADIGRRNAKAAARRSAAVEKKISAAAALKSR